MDGKLPFRLVHHLMYLKMLFGIYFSHVDVKSTFFAFFAFCVFWRIS
jgi:hypothetical protein